MKCVKKNFLDTFYFMYQLDMRYWILYTDLTVNFLDPKFLDLETYTKDNNDIPS